MPTARPCSSTYASRLSGPRPASPRPRRCSRGAAPAALLPLSDLNGDRKQWTEFLEKNRAKELILYCRSGHRAGRAAKLLAGEGFRTANAGGFGDWQSANLPVRKSDQPAR